MLQRALRRFIDVAVFPHNLWRHRSSNHRHLRQAVQAAAAILNVTDVALPFLFLQ
jgi:hypothetical protein